MHIASKSQRSFRQPLKQRRQRLVLSSSMARIRRSRIKQMELRAAPRLKGYQLASHLCSRPRGLYMVVISSLQLPGPVWLDISPELFEILQRLLTNSSRPIWVSRRGGFSSPEPNDHIVDGLLRVLQSKLMGVALVSFAPMMDGYINNDRR